MIDKKNDRTASAWESSCEAMDALELQWKLYKADCGKERAGQAHSEVSSETFKKWQNPPQTKNIIVRCFLVPSCGRSAVAKDVLGMLLSYVNEDSETILNNM